MRTISEKTPPPDNLSGVARYIDFQIEAMRPFKTQNQISDAAGLPQRNLLSMIRNGRTKVPLERIPALAKALNVDPNHLFLLAFSEYYPRVKAILDEATLYITTRREQQLIDVWRSATASLDPPIELVEQEFRQLAQRAFGGTRQGLTPKPRASQ